MGISKKFSKTLLLGLILYFGNQLNSQSVFVPINEDYQHLIDRLEIKSGKLSNDVFSIHKSYARKHIVSLTDSVLNDTIINWSKRDLFNILYLRDDNWEWADSGSSKKPILRYFYEKKNALYQKTTPDFLMIANPIFHVKIGREPSAKYENLYQNTRGFEIRGHVDNKIGFYAMVAENQAIFPEYARLTDTVPLVIGQNYSKKTPNRPQESDFLSARGYITANLSKHWALQFGHDKNFIGNGMRSLVLSDHAGSYLFLRSLLKIWKFQYTNIFAQMTATPTINDSYFRKKYSAFHHLSINLNRNINIGLFEIVNFGRPDNGFDLNYLNPVIFYRSVEQNLGSYDNAFLGFDWKVNFLKHFSWYGQVLLDEFLIGKIRERKGDWVNKQAFQTGVKYIDVFGIKNLDAQGELNVIRPFVYQHLDLERSHSHYLQPLAHPSGANFRELIGVLRYQPIDRVFLTGKLIVINQGVDTLGSVKNVGADVRRSYNDRIEPDGVGKTTGHIIGQGIQKDVLFSSFTLTWMPRHNLFVDLVYIKRVQSSDQPLLRMDRNILTLSLRMNIGAGKYEF